MEKPTCKIIEKLPDNSPCQEQYSGLGNRIVVVNQGEQEVTQVLLQRIADDQGVSIMKI